MGYSSPYREESCQNCEYAEYDSFHDEIWCSHDPQPNNLGSSCLVNRNGHCEYFEKEDK